MAERSQSFPFCSCKSRFETRSYTSFAAKVLVPPLVALAVAGAFQSSLRAQGHPEALEAQAVAPPLPPPALPPGVHLRLPRDMMPPQYQTPEAQVPETEAPPAQSLPTPTRIVTPPSQIISSGSQPTGPSLKIEYALGKLSVTANQVSLSEVLREVSQKTGLEVRGLTEAGQVASIQFSNLPVSEAIRNLLGGTNYVLFGKPNSPDGVRQARVVILSATSGAPIDTGAQTHAAQ